MKVITFDEHGNAQEQRFEFPKLPEWKMAKDIGYEPQTTFWDDFSIADLYGLEAIADTYKRAFAAWKHDVKYIAEMTLVLNHKGIWYWQASQQYDDDEKLRLISDLYLELYWQLKDWAQRNFDGDDAEYFFNVTD